MEINIGDLVLENEIELGAVELDVKTETPNIENLNITPMKQTQIFTHPNSYGYDKVTVEAISDDYIIPEGTLDISENGEYDVKNYETANVNFVQNNIVLPDTTKFTQTTIVEFPAGLSFSSIINGQSLFSSSLNLKRINSVLDLSSCTKCTMMFNSCSNLEEVQITDTNKVTNIQSMFKGCTKLVTITAFETKNLDSNDPMRATFTGCTSLSDNSLNNILLMCINATKIAKSYRTLAKIGLTSEQATRCQGLSNYADFIAAGWTTGY